MSTFSTEDLFDACKKGDIARVRRAVADRVDVRKVIDKNWANRTPLHCASWYVVCACETHPPSHSDRILNSLSIIKRVHAYTDLKKIFDSADPAYGWGDNFGLSCHYFDINAN